ncbi:hypothetical protein FHG87_014382 [Trinorchestia longiramus]|nr:hypothetical protein FHG87_014382 [Trinorchestia longiramus]
MRPTGPAMPVLEACCCCDLLTGSIVAGVYTIVVYCLAFSLSVWWLLDETMYRSEHTSSSGRIPGYVLCGGHLTLVLASIVMLYGLYKRMDRVVLCWVLLMVLVFFPEMGLVLFVNLYHRTVVTPSGMLDLALYTVRAAVNVVCILCVHSLYTTWRRSNKQDLHSSYHISAASQNQLSLPKDALEDESLYNGNLYNGQSIAYPASLYSQPAYAGYNGHDNRSFSGYDNRSLNGYEGRYGYASNGYDGRFENGSANSIIAVSKELVPSKVSSTASQLEYRALPRSSSRSSLGQNSAYGGQQLVPAQFNAALYASATSLTNIGPYYMRSMQHQRQLLSPGRLHAAAYLQQMVHYLPQDYATQSLDRRGSLVLPVRRDEDCDNLSLRGVGLRGARQGFILTPRGRGRGRGRGSLTSLGAESDELGRYRDVAL